MKVQLPWIGKAAGSSAGMIYQSYWGRTYARSFPSMFHYPNTPSQQACQSAFHDIRRIWQPIYNELKHFVSSGQRSNRSIYNIYMKSIFRLLNPYGVPKNDVIPSNFGLDRYNTKRVDLGEASLVFRSSDIMLLFTQNSLVNTPYNKTTSEHFILINKTDQTLYYRIASYSPSRRNMDFKNTYRWSSSDDILCFVAISVEGWMGNFNLLKIQ